MTAVNTAFDDLAAQQSAMAGAIMRADPRALAAQVAEIQEQGVRHMAAISQAISAAVRQIGD
jgi:hypothetical protein